MSGISSSGFFSVSSVTPSSAPSSASIQRANLPPAGLALSVSPLGDGSGVRRAKYRVSFRGVSVRGESSSASTSYTLPCGHLQVAATRSATTGPPTPAIHGVRARGASELDVTHAHFCAI